MGTNSGLHLFCFLPFIFHVCICIFKVDVCYMVLIIIIIIKSLTKTHDWCFSLSIIFHLPRFSLFFPCSKWKHSKTSNKVSLQSYRSLFVSLCLSSMTELIVCYCFHSQLKLLEISFLQLQEVDFLFYFNFIFF